MAKLTSGTIARSRREELGMTREQLAAKASVSISTIARLELSDQLPGTRNLYSIAAALEVSADALALPACAV
ncbi:helix-turn-helix transcriptional regulator [Rhodococcus qingshengii]|uniref:helix-turn-helix transcriptional regulator n=1 Tax=Rhodococcus qingshengii TaxID=334542 RepID=UPI001BE6765D|nr:helix-turn-helix transcriptional regulator [Rhodococcus qingshengii]